MRRSLGIAGAVLVVLELGLHVFGFRSPQFERPIVLWSPDRDGLVDTKDALFQRDASCLWSPRPGALVPLDASDASAGRAVDPKSGAARVSSTKLVGDSATDEARSQSKSADLERINSAGYRGPIVSVQRPQGVLRIMTLGDSAAFGAGVRYDDTFSARLASSLADLKVKAEVIDAGVGAFTVRQMLERYRVLGRVYHPKIVIVAVSGHEDSRPAIDLSDDDKIALSLERNSGLKGLRRRIRSHIRTMQLLSWIRHRSALAEVLAASESEVHEAQASEHDAGSPDWNGKRRVSPNECAMFLSMLRRETSADGARFILVAMPHRKTIDKESPVVRHYLRTVISTAIGEDAQVLDAQSRFDGRAMLEGGEDPLFIDDWNPSPFGHDLIAQWLVPLVREQTRNRGMDPASITR
jgi:hypothetical protein